MTDELTLAAEFPPPSSDAWLALVDKVLKGKPFDRLVTRTLDGVEVQPLYVAADAPTARDEPGMPGFTPQVRAATAPPRPKGAWEVRATLVHPDPSRANEAVLGELGQGATGVALRFDQAFRRGVAPDGDGWDDAGAVDGVAVHSKEALAAALDGVHLDLVPLSLYPGGRFADAARWLDEIWCERGLGAEDVSGCMGADPLGTLAAEGRLAGGLDAGLAQLGALARRCAESTPRVRAAHVDASPFAEAGGSPAEQLAALLATGVAYLRAMEAAGLDVTTAARQIEATVAVDADVFASIATVRAARRVWSAVLEAGGVPADQRGLRVHARTASRMMTRVDPWVNLLRVTSAVFSAGIAGADAVTALPFDVVLGFPTDLGWRLARNTQLILQEEAHAGRVIDPPGGSWYVESLTEEIAARAWAAFQEIEAAGGMAAALRAGSFRARIAATRERRRRDLATRRQPLTGATEFPLLGETLPETVPVDRAAARAAVVRPPVAVAPAEIEEVDAFTAHRDAEEIEAMRAAADDHRRRHGAPPRVFLANLGPIATHTARATWARSFYEAGGVEALTNDGFAGPADAAEAFRESGAGGACLCSSDAAYAELAVPTAEALKAAGAIRVELAGNPGDSRAAYEAAGIDGFVHVGVDQVEHLRTLHGVLGVGR